MHRRISELVDFLDAQRAELLEAASAVSDQRWCERPVPDRWSVSEVIEHLSIVEHGCARAIAARAAAARAANHPAETDTSSVLGVLDGRRLVDRSNRLQASERSQPTGGWTRERALAALQSSRAELYEAIHAADGLALSSVRLGHPRLGELDLYQWMLFVGQHEVRHLDQINEVSEQLTGSGR